MIDELAQAIADFLASGPRAVHSRATEVARMIRAHPEHVDALPQPPAVDDPGKRGYVARWRASVFAGDAAPTRLRALLEACEPELRARLVHELGNRDAALPGPFVELVATMLDDASAEVVVAASYAFARHAARGGDLASVLDALVRRLGDARKAGKQKVADAAETTLSVGFRNARDVDPYFAALTRAEDAATKRRAKAVATRWTAREADPVESAARRLRAGLPAERIAACRSLAGLLAIDVVDIRTSFDAIALALAHDDVAVREAAADLAVIACEAQGGVEEVSHLVRPLLDARQDASPAVRDAVAQALGFVNGHRATRGMTPLG